MYCLWIQTILPYFLSQSGHCFMNFLMPVLYTRIISPEYAIFIKINTSVFGMLFEYHPVCYVHVPCDISGFTLHVHWISVLRCLYIRIFLASFFIIVSMLLFCLLSQAFSSWYFSWTNNDPYCSGFKFQTAVLLILCVMFLV